MITWNDFEKIEMLAGTIIDAKIFDGARKPAYQLWIDFGTIGIKKSSAQITVLYEPGQLVGKQVIAVVNFPGKLIAGFRSECLVLGIYNENNDVVLLSPERPVSNGCKIG